MYKRLKKITCKSSQSFRQINIILLNDDKDDDSREDEVIEELSQTLNK